MDPSASTPGRSAIVQHERGGAAGRAGSERGGGPQSREPGVLCASCNAREGLNASGSAGMTGSANWEERHFLGHGRPWADEARIRIRA